MAAAPRHAFFETDDRIELNIFVKGVSQEEATVFIEPRKVTFRWQEILLILDPLRGEVDVDRSETKVGKVKVEIHLFKKSTGRWGGLVGEAPAEVLQQPPSAQAQSGSQKDWDVVANEALDREGKDKTTTEDPNVGGDAAVNSFFQQIYAGADEDTRRAMLKSYTESGGTALSTDWNEVSKGKVEVKPASGQEARKW